MDPILISVVAFVAVAGLVAAVMMAMGDMGGSKAEERLAALSGGKVAATKQLGVTREEMFREAAGGLSGAASGAIAKFGSLKNLFEQSKSPISPAQFLVITVGIASFGLAAAIAFQLPTPLWPVVSLPPATFPLLWLLWRRKQRFDAFGAALPEALSLIARALRSGSSLGQGIKAVVDEMEGPIAEEFHLAYEAQNLGVPIDQALKDVYLRIPNMDFKFFATSVAVQKTSGGDLSEVLEKISSLVRERFQIKGMVKALTGEGRISGVVLMALPVALFFAVLYLNPDYVMLLFEDPLGQKMISGAIVLQILGAFAIKKCVDIKI